MIIMGNLMHVDTGAEAFIESLNWLGVDHIFLNPGRDTIPIQGTIAQYKVLGKKAPNVILCPHESVAVAAAHGYAMVSGKPQVVTVFEDIGTIQGGGSIVNLQCGRIPVILCAGRNPYPNRINWLKESCDQRRITRDYVKWDHEVQINENISSVLQEAFRVASIEPCGPVYLSIPHEIMKGKTGDLTVSAPIILDEMIPSESDINALHEAADILIRAENPLVMTAYFGRHPESVATLVELAETLSARVMTTDLRMNFPSTHPLCPGIDSTEGDSYDHFITEADVVLVIDYHFPGPREKKVAPRPDAKIIHIDMEPFKRGKPLWDRHPHIRIKGDTRKLLPALNEIIRERQATKPDLRLRDRFERVANENSKLKEEWRTVALNEAGQKPISSEWLHHCINEIADEEAIIIHMAPSTAASLAHQIRRTKPGTLYSWGECNGSMGWPLGAALGAKLAAPDKIVISLIGDGGFLYGCPVSTLWATSSYNAPFLTIIENNQSYKITKGGIGTAYGESSVSGEMGFEVGIDIKMPPDYALIAKACRAYGQVVEDPSELLSALKNAIEQVRMGKSAVLDVRQWDL
jgi:acetolactate synthase-1/2/3 large subunit